MNLGFGLTKRQRFDPAENTTELPRIADMAPEILSATFANGVCEVECADGVLEVTATDGSVRLDSGLAVRLQELIGVADAYWQSGVSVQRG